MKSSENLCYQYNAFLPAAIHIAGVNYIKAWRQHAGLTLQQLGEALEPPASAGTIHTYESGKRRVGQRRLEEIAAVLKTSPGKLLDEPPPAPGAAIIAIPGEVVDLWKHILERDRANEAIALLRVIAESAEPKPDPEQK